MTNSNSVTVAAVTEPDRPIPLYPLVYLAEGEDVTVGRADIDVYLIMPSDGAEAVRRLASGIAPSAVAAWYLACYGEQIDVDDLVETLEQAGFVRPAGQSAPVAAARIGWQRLGSAMFSWPAWALYAGLLIWALVASVRRPDLLPHYRQFFFTDYYSVIEVVLFAAAVPLVLLHEGFHALAGRRLGLRTSLGIGRRLYFIVLETSMDGLVAVPRRRRYLPILAGMFADLLVVAVLILAADLTRTPGGGLSTAGRICLAVALASWLRIAWQFSIYLKTDLYVLLITVLGAVDLHAVTKQMLRNRVHRLLGRTERVVDPASWHPVDRRAGRWYVVLMVVGYSVSIASFVVVAIPILIGMTRDVIERLANAGHTPLPLLLDAVVVAGIAVTQFALYGWLTLRDRRRRRRLLRTET